MWTNMVFNGMFGISWTIVGFLELELILFRQTKHSSTILRMSSDILGQNIMSLALFKHLSTPICQMWTDSIIWRRESLDMSILQALDIIQSVLFNLSVIMVPQFLCMRWAFLANFWPTILYDVLHLSSTLIKFVFCVLFLRSPAVHLNCHPQ